MACNGSGSFADAHEQVAYWESQVCELQLVARVGDHVLVDAPPRSMAAPANGQTGIIEAYPSAWPGWVLVRPDDAPGGNLGVMRFRPDELKVI